MRITNHHADWLYFCAIYGIWYCDDGRVVAFNRNYEPILIWDEKAGQLYRPASCKYFRRSYEDFDPIRDRPDRPVETIWWTRMTNLYTDANPPWRNAKTRIRVMTVLCEFLNGEIPRFETIEAMNCGMQ